ncbi:MAG: TAXI family TRAP transporter solute-binding subunit, partial [Pseudomonadota bacterium]
YILSTASTGGTYYPVGVALATLAKVRLEPTHGFGISAISSAGSGENIRLLRENEAQFAILQGLFGYYARTGTGPIEADGPQENLRSITTLWGNTEHFVIDREYLNTGTLADFAAIEGEGMALGAQNSGTLGSNRTLLAGMGVDIDEQYDLFYAGYGPSVEALQNRQIAGAGIPGGVPVGALSQLFASAGDRVALLDVTDEEMQQADNGMNLWTRFVIPAGVYPGIDRDVQTITQPNFLGVRDDVDEEHVYLFTKAIYENLGFLQAIHPATNEMSLEAAIAGLPFPLHPGAIRYYEEAGVEIPDRLRP